VREWIEKNVGIIFPSIDETEHRSLNSG